MLTLKSAKNPQYQNQNETAINLEVQFEEFGDTWLPFTAMSTDLEAHGRDIYARTINGEFGAIAPYIHPVAPPATEPQPDATGTQTL
jgi:hypothetical protein